MKNKRKPIPIKLRFEVFKRDSFKCQYCGYSAPDALLQVDHINPVKRGGKNDIINLITSCAKCNMGKGATPLDDNTAMAKSKKQMDELNERRQQLEMMAKWKEQLLDMNAKYIETINKMFQSHGCVIPKYLIGDINNLVRKYGFDEAFESLSISLDTYGLQMHNSTPVQWSFERLVRKAGGIAYIRKSKTDDPEWSRYYYVRGILRRRFKGYDEDLSRMTIRKNYELGLPMDCVEYAAKKTASFAEFIEYLPLMLREVAKDGNHK